MPTSPGPQFLYYEAASATLAKAAAADASLTPLLQRFTPLVSAARTAVIHRGSIAADRLAEGAAAVEACDAFDEAEGVVKVVREFLLKQQEGEAK